MRLFKKVSRVLILIVGIVIGLILALSQFNQYQSKMYLNGEPVKNFSEAEFENIMMENPEAFTQEVFVNIPFFGSFWTNNVPLGTTLHFAITLLILSLCIYSFWEIRKFIPIEKSQLNKS